ncbi:MAG: phage Gp37/Gp68 family protein [Methylocella sp.]
MGAISKIEWTDYSWNPILARLGYMLGFHCEHMSEGCSHCYAETINRRLGTGLDFKPGNLDKLEISVAEKTLLAPLSWKKPKRISVCSMTDLFGEWVKDEWRDRMFAVMALCPQHTWQVLTKRPKRMRGYFAPHDLGLRWANAIEALGLKGPSVETALDWDHNNLPNVWLGTSCEDQATADERIPDLLATPAAVRFVSCEPLLGPISLRWLSGIDHRALISTRGRATELDGVRCIDWMIVRGESGPGARPMPPDWPRSIRDQCKQASVAYFHKHNGEYLPAVGQSCKYWVTNVGGLAMSRVGKKLAGRLLDGREHNEFPA